MLVKMKSFFAKYLSFQKHIQREGMYLCVYILTESKDLRQHI